MILILLFYQLRSGFEERKCCPLNSLKLWGGNRITVQQAECGARVKGAVPYYNQAPTL